jgi:hypothetical protein
MKNKIQEKLEWMKANDPRFKNMFTGPNKIELAGIPSLEGMMVKFRHPNDQPYVEVARISEPGAFGQTNIAVYIYGRNDYAAEFDQPHFFVNLENKKKKNIVFQIPDLNQPLQELKILWDFDKKDKGRYNRTSLKEKIIRWLPDLNADDPLHSNHEMMIIEWNLLNKGNPQVQKMEWYK